MQLLLGTESPVWDVQDAGTTMRFLTAYAAAKGLKRTLTGTPRMCRRPIGELVEALKSLGAEIRYVDERGFPPHEILKGIPFHPAPPTLSIRGDISSQYISALLMIAPTIGGLKLQITTPLGSRPYVEMTLGLMRHFGVDSLWEGNVIAVPDQPYTAQSYIIESDWSGASYWYSMAALSSQADIFLEGLRHPSFQGDAAIATYMEPLGVTTEFVENGVWIRKQQTPAPYPTDWEIDFTDTPDLAQTMAVAAAALNVPLRLSGLQSLRIKETDRILALQQELAKFGVSFQEVEPGIFALSGAFHPAHESVKTYEDHRMAMAFAPLALRQEGLRIEDPEVVEKSYPAFWEHLQLVRGKIED